jgi:hypothetical protein
LAVPSGATQRLSSGWVLDTFEGHVDIVAAFTGGAFDSVGHTINIAASETIYGGEPNVEGWSWSHLRRFVTGYLAPPDALASYQGLGDWCEGITCEITIYYRGGPRIVDCVVWEEPYGYSRDVGVDATSTYSTPLAVGAGGQPPGVYPSTFPVEEISGTDPRFGATLLADVVDRQQHSIGPIAAQWSGWRESQAVTALEAVGVTTTSLTYVNLLNTSITAWASASPGWSLASGGQAQQADTSDARRITRDKDACVPVRCWVYGSRTGSGTSTVRFQSENYSIAEVLITSSTAGWWSDDGSSPLRPRPRGHERPADPRQAGRRRHPHRPPRPRRVPRRLSNRTRSIHHEQLLPTRSSSASPSASPATPPPCRRSSATPSKAFVLANITAGLLTFDNGTDIPANAIILGCLRQDDHAAAFSAGTTTGVSAKIGAASGDDDGYGALIAIGGAVGLKVPEPGARLGVLNTSQDIAVIFTATGGTPDLAEVNAGAGTVWIAYALAPTT